MFINSPEHSSTEVIKAAHIGIWSIRHGLYSNSSSMPMTKKHSPPTKNIDMCVDPRHAVSIRPYDMPPAQ